ncbi:MAG: SEC-C metal-binding domain-containing protein [Patescibacteria group bacterium]
MRKFGKSKIGRNDPCYCGSGKKYKKCHLGQDEKRPTQEDMQEVISHFQKIQAEQAALESKGYYLPHIQTEYQGKRVRAVGGRLYHSLPLKQTFHEFIIELLGVTLGEPWVKEQLTLPESEQHYIIQCYIHYNDWKKRNALPSNRVGERWGAMPDGWSKSLFALAFDVYCVQHRAKLFQRQINRLKNLDQYQGARYEIAIAAIFTRLGFEIEFLDRGNPKAPHCEFIATHKGKNISIAVEAKSRHRHGVIHTPGTANLEELMRADVRDKLEEALAQNPGGIPFMIFIDLNAPLTPGMNFPDKPWFEDIKRNVDSLGAHDQSNPSEENGIFFTNFSFHYQTDKEAEPAEHVAVLPIFSKNPIVDTEIYNLLNQGLSNYGHVPNLE